MGVPLTGLDAGGRFITPSFLFRKINDRVKNIECFAAGSLGDP